MLISFHPWILTRINIIYSMIIDIVIYTLFVGKFKLYDLSLNSNFSILFLIFYWILISYISGIYHINDLNIIFRIKKIVQTTTAHLLIYYLSIFIFYKIFNLDYQIFYGGLYIHFTKYVLITSSFQFGYQKIFQKKLNFLNEWYVLGSKTFFHNLCELNKKKNLKLKFINHEEISFDRQKQSRNFILENLNSYSYSIQKSIIELNFNGSNTCDVVTWCELLLQKIPLEYMSSSELLKLFSKLNLNNGFELRLKRVGDLIVSIIILFISFPLILIFGILIYLEDKGPILYFQKRVGRNGVNFRICKLRTMIINAEKDGVQWSRKEDSRITRIGRFLRKTRLDEIPQLFSVLIGEMSLIGPRPERPEIDAMLKDEIPFYEMKYLIKPGLSGWAQVNYPYGSSVKDSEIKLSFDFYYIKNFSFWLDFIIFCKTIRLVLRREGSIPKN